jgi:hypothetical protein
MTITIRNIALVVALFSVSLAANSASIAWQIDITLPADPDNSDFTPDPSVGLITGTFVLDTVTLLLSDVNASATGTAFAAPSASLIDAFAPYDESGRYFELLPTAPTNVLTGVEDILIKLDLPGLTGASVGDIIDVTYVSLYDCLDFDCFDFEETYTSYQVTGTLTAVPVPAAAWLFGSAIGLLGWMRRKAS